MESFDDRTINVWISWSLLFSYAATLIPYKIAYIEDGDFPEWDIFDNIIDSIFLLDMILTFFSAYYDSQNNLVTNWKYVFKNYIKTWFVIDLIVLFLLLLK